MLFKTGINKRRNKQLSNKNEWHTLLEKRNPNLRMDNEGLWPKEGDE